MALLVVLLMIALWWQLRPGEPDPGPTMAPAEVAEPRLLGPRSRPEPALLLRLERASIAGTVRDARGQPLAGAQVCASANVSWLAAPGLGSDETRALHCVKAEAGGRYLIEGLFAVRHTVHASAAGHIPGPFVRGEGASRREFVELRAGMAAQKIDLTLEAGGVEVHGVVKDLSGGAVEGAQVRSKYAYALTGADGVFTLWVRPGHAYLSARADGYAAAEVGGAAPGHRFELFLTPEAVLVGTVVRAGDGTPVEGARVTAQDSRFRWNDAAAITDASGNYRLDGLEPGAYKATAEADDLAGSAAEQVVLGLGETSEAIEIPMHPAFSVEGKVVIAGGQACEAGSVNLRDPARSIHTEVEADGVVRLRGLLPGEYQVSVHCTGYVPAATYPRVTIVDRSLKELRWEVSRGQSIRGVVVDSAGEAVATVQVNARAQVDPGKPRAQQTSVGGIETDARGRFELAGLLPGEYDVNVHASQPARATLERPVRVRVPEGEDPAELRIELPATGEVRGSVRDPQGRPVARIEVSLDDGKHRQSASVADDGSFSFPHVAAGEYRATARRGWETLAGPGSGADDVQGEKVTVRTGGVETIKLVVGDVTGKIAGIVRDQDGAPVIDAFIDATLESERAGAGGWAAHEGRFGSLQNDPTLTDQDGRFALAGLPTGKHTLRAHRKGGGEAILEHVEPGSDVILTIAATARISGIVAARGGGSPEEFTIKVADASTGFERRDRFFRTAGAWSLAEVPAGKYKVSVTADAGSAEVEVNTTAGEDTTGVRIELAPKVTVRGTVVDLEGTPVAGLQVTIYAEGGVAWGGGDEQQRNITDDAGNFEVTRAPTGRVTVQVQPPTYHTEDFGQTFIPTVIEATGDTAVLPPLRVARKRVKPGEVRGDLGYTLKQEAPGEDPRTRRLVVALVRPGGPAAAAGLQVDDELVSIDGRDVTGPNAYLLPGLTTVAPGTSVTLGLARGESLQVLAGAPP